MVLLEQDGFLVELSKLYAKSKMSGSVFLTIKRHSGPTGGAAKVGGGKFDKKVEGKDKKKAGTSQQQVGDEGEHRCIVRATDGKKAKISCVVAHKDVVRFQMALSNVLKVHLDALKKKEKKAAAKRKTKASASL
eukprot:EC124153.1.p1 GENE.EC124153.1~~EC124153.1.p1  ORF type:complete len:134 (+),score=24.12 EC124153.1:151-552(+)